MKRMLLTKMVLVALFVAGTIWALRVSPGSFSTQYVPLGHPQDTGITLVCYAPNAKFVLASVIEPDVKDMPHCVGYRPIPDVSWFILDGDTLLCDSSGTARSKMAINIPDKPELYNQHFIVRVFVTAEGNGMFQPAIIPYYFIETPPLENPPVPPAGRHSLAPSVLNLSVKKPTGKFILYNNDSTSHSYILNVRAPERSSRRFPNLTHNFMPIKDTSAVIVSPETTKIAGNAQKTISVRWIRAAAINSPTEAIVLITADDGETNFVRLKMKPNDE